ncbi:MAG TPA: hypothetical protein VKB78_03240, partial [Pirellulales bacterium]|nr:hypothetical protein [Pirellulales bacterium]
FNGDGKADVAGLNGLNGEWRIGISGGRSFSSQPAGTWPADAEWRQVTTGRFSADARRGIVAVDLKSHRLAIAEFDGRHFTTRFLPAVPAVESQMFVGRFAGDEADNLLGISNTGDLWIGRLDGGSIRYEQWGRLPDVEHLTDFHVISVWR